MNKVFFLALLGFGTALFGVDPVRAAPGCLSGGCHQALTGVKYLHGPVAAEMAGGRGCVMCHEPAGAKCTAARGGIFKLKGRTLCFTCHDKGTGSQHSLGQVESKCLLCHDPHGSESSRQFVRSGGGVLPGRK